MPSGLTVTRIGQRPQLAQMERDWDEFFDPSEVASPFLIPGWQLSWLDTYGVKHRPFVLAAHLAGELVGLWPLALRRRGPFKVLDPIGAGPSDWLDILVRSNYREAVLSLFLRYLSENRSAWDLIEHRDVLADSPNIPVLESLCRAESLHMRRQPRTISPYLKINSTWEQFLSSKRAKFRSNLKYYRRLPERNGQRLTIDRLPWGPDDKTVDTLAAVELRSWKAHDGNLKVTTRVGRDFYRGSADILPDGDCSKSGVLR